MIAQKWNPRASSRLSQTIARAGGIMAKEKSILEKFSETVKGLADSASQALKGEEPARVDETSAAYMPFAAEGLVSDPLLVPPIAVQPARRKRRTAKKSAGRRVAKSAKKSTPKKSAAKKSTGKTARKAASARSKPVTKTAKRRAGAKKAARKRGRR
jgi:hypothetical protein